MAQIPPITLTPAAVERVKALIAEAEAPAVALWVGLKTKGCSGMSYDMRLLGPQEVAAYQALPRFERPEAMTQDGVTIYIDNKAMLALIGTEMDWVDDGIAAKFDFKNPNEKARCGCGESFNV